MTAAKLLLKLHLNPESPSRRYKHLKTNIKFNFKKLLLGMKMAVRIVIIHVAA